jgi:CRP/FNR family transcriptional regulator, cyclic AMP receptor protein
MLTFATTNQGLDMKPFTCLNQVQMERLLHAADSINLSPKTMLYQPDDYCDAVYFVLDGVIKVGNFSTDKREIIKNIVSKGSIIGLQALTNQNFRNEFAKTMQMPVKVLRIESAVYEDLMRENQQFFFETITILINRLAQAERQLASLLSNDVRTRIIGFLKEYASKLEQETPIEALLRFGLTQKDIANMVGASRQTVAIILNELRNEERIDFDRNSFILHDL